VWDGLFQEVCPWAETGIKDDTDGAAGLRERMPQVAGLSWLDLLRRTM
jgi:hypothetical protein